MKSELEAIASQYAEAIIELAYQNQAEPELCEKILADLTLINETINGPTELKLILEHPSISSPEKKTILKLIFDGKVNEWTLRLLELLNDKRRLKLLPVIETQYKEKLNARKNIITAKLVSATALSDRTVADIQASLTKNLGKVLKLEVSQDDSLIGGFVLRLGDQVIDGSLKNKLRNLEKVLLSV